LFCRNFSCQVYLTHKYEAAGRYSGMTSVYSHWSSFRRLLCSETALNTAQRQKFSEKMSDCCNCCFACSCDSRCSACLEGKRNRFKTDKKHLKNVGPIRHCEPPHALILHCHSPGVATVARRHCRTPPTHRYPRQRQRVTEGTAMAP